MNDSGVILCEHEKECVLPHNVGEWELVKLLKHGGTSVSIYRKNSGEGDDE